ncbi:hypothetical protein IE4771_CH01260 [Rhizobium etli bv. mimosae str. IE4771]|uniref:Uncharacterized protein n=1 Tax=Rhizobium etli bv. mimosae str. IE4771 TaxID=1432050 RepID=A0A060HY22_RHIET|nr:hypothetical protein IE4771_CH01260 [Rhizobium sp. IE4771]
MDGLHQGGCRDGVERRPQGDRNSRRVLCAPTVSAVLQARGRKCRPAYLSQPADLAKTAGRTDIAVTGLPTEIVGSYDDRAVVKGGGKL